MFVNIGLGALVRSEDVLVVAVPWRDPIRRCIDLAGREGRLVDASGNKKRRSAIIMRDGTVVLSMYSCESMARRLNGKVTEEQRGTFQSGTGEWWGPCKKGGDYVVWCRSDERWAEGI